MWRYDQMRYGIVVIALISVSLQIIGFSSLDWLAVETFGQESAGKPQKGKLDGAPGKADETLSKHDEGQGKPAGANMPDKNGNGLENIKPGKEKPAGENMPDKNGNGPANIKPGQGKPAGAKLPDKNGNGPANIKPGKPGIIPPSKTDKPLSAGKGDRPSEKPELKPRPSPMDKTESANDRNKPLVDRSEPPSDENTSPKDDAGKVKPTLDRKKRSAASMLSNDKNKQPTDEPRTPVALNDDNRLPIDKQGRPVTANDENGRPAEESQRPLASNNGNKEPVNKPIRPMPRPRPQNNENKPLADQQEKPMPSNTGDKGPVNRPTPTNLVLTLVNRTRKPAVWVTRRPAPDGMGKSTPANTARPLPDKMGNATKASNVNKRPTLKPRPWLIARPTPAPRPNGKNKYTPSPPQTNNGDRSPANGGEALENFRNKGIIDPSWIRGRLPTSEESAGGRPAGVAGARKVASRARTVISIGLWTCKQCMANQAGTEDCETFTAVKGLNTVRLLAPRLSDFDVTASTWHSLRVETVLALLFGLAGLAGFVLGVKPGCLAHRRKPIVVAGICAMAISFILYLVAVTRVAAINEELRTNFRDLGDNFALHAPWAAAVGGVGACLALVAAGLQGISMWMDERRKWSKFQDEVVFTNKSEANATAPPADSADVVSGSGDESKAGNYEMLA